MFNVFSVYLTVIKKKSTEKLNRKTMYTWLELRRKLSQIQGNVLASSLVINAPILKFWKYWYWNYFYTSGLCWWEAVIWSRYLTFMSIFKKFSLQMGLLHMVNFEGPFDLLQCLLWQIVLENTPLTIC